MHEFLEGRKSGIIRIAEVRFVRKTGLGVVVFRVD